MHSGSSATCSPIRTRAAGWVAAAVRGDGRARGELLALISPLVLRYCRARLGRRETALGSADDVAQDVCMAVVSALQTYRSSAVCIGVDRISLCEAVTRLVVGGAEAIVPPRPG